MVKNKRKVMAGKPIYDNKTHRYLLPELYLRNVQDLLRLNKLFCGCFIGDFIYSRYRGDISNCMFMVYAVNNKYKRTLFDNTIKKIRKSKYYIEDYPLEGVKNRKTHVIIITVPEIKYTHFKWSEYSLMYTPEELDKMELSEMSIIRKVLQKDIKYKQFFMERIRQEYDVSISLDDDREFDSPINVQEEFLN